MKLLFIVGPTASGKSDFAVAAAKMLNTEVISADSMQIYRSMDVGTAKISKIDMRGVQHRMIDIVDPKENFSAAEYQKKALLDIERLIRAGKVPVICGGTGLYIDSIIYPLNFSDSARNCALRDSLLNDAARFGNGYLYEKLQKFDPKSAEKIHINDTKRIIRALEINLSAKKSRTDTDKLEKRYDYLMIGFNAPDRSLLYDRINKRVDRMFENGLETEVRGLVGSGVDFGRQSMQAIGYKEFKPFFDGEITESELVETIKKNTRNYAKRQLTWFKKYPDIRWFDSPDEKVFDLIQNTFMKV